MTSLSQNKLVETANNHPAQSVPAKFEIGHVPVDPQPSNDNNLPSTH